MESLVYTHLALAYEDTSTLELSNIQIFDVLIKLNLLALLKQQKSICKAWVYGLSLSLTFIPLSASLALHLAERREQVSSLLFQPTSETILAQSPSSLSLEEKGETQPSSISSPRNEEQGKVLFAKGGEEAVNRTYPVNTTAYLQTHSGVELVQYAENKAPVSNPNFKAKPKKVSSNKLLISKPEPISKTQPEQKGKLRLVNDSPYTAIVFLYRPGEKQPYRYANIPACHQRELLATYSNLWKVSFNSHKAFSLGEVSVKNRDLFEVKTSKLGNKEPWINSCQDAAISQPVVDIDVLTQQEILEFSNTINTMKNDLQKINSFLPLKEKIQLESAGLMEITVQKMMLIVNDLNPNQVNSSQLTSTAYCFLQKYLNIWENQYNNNLKINNNKPEQTIFYDGYPSISELNLTRNYFVKPNHQKDFIILFEIYHQAKNIYNDSKYNSVHRGNPVNPQPNSQPINNDECRAKLNDGLLAQINVSDPRKKSKFC